MPNDPGEMAGRSLRRGLLIVAEGLDGSGKSATLDGLAGWLERRGRKVRTVAWLPSGLVQRAAADPRSRMALTPRVAALMAAADAQRRIGLKVARWLARGDVVLADRYAWTAIAREVARGLELDWSIELHRTLPAPDLILFHRGEAGSSVERALAARPSSVRSAAVGAAYGSFVERLLAAFEALVESRRRRPGHALADADRDDRRPSGSGCQCDRRPGCRSDDPRARPPRRCRVKATVAGDLGAPGGPPRHGQPGLFIVLEGTDRAGRSTHVRRLEQQLRYRGRGVTRTSLATSILTARAIRSAKRERRMDPVETALLYAADLAERIEQVILPSLRAGLVVLADRYVYTPMARAATRGVDPAWLDWLFSFAPAPDLTLLLEVDAETALARQGRQRLDRYEAGHGPGPVVGCPRELPPLPGPPPRLVRAARGSLQLHPDRGARDAGRGRSPN